MNITGTLGIFQRGIRELITKKLIESLDIHNLENYIKKITNDGK